MQELLLETKSGLVTITRNSRGGLDYKVPDGFSGYQLTVLQLKNQELILQFTDNSSKAHQPFDLQEHIYDLYDMGYGLVE